MLGKFKLLMVAIKRKTLPEGKGSSGFSPANFFFLKILFSRTFKNSGGVMVRRHFPNLALPIFDFAPPLNAIAIIPNLPILAGGYSPPCAMDRRNYCNVRTSRIPWVMF